MLIIIVVSSFLSCFMLSIQAQLWDNVYNNVTVYEEDRIIPISVSIFPTNVKTVLAVEDVVPKLTCVASGTYISHFRPYVLSWFIDDDSVQIEYNATRLQLNRTLSSADINKEIYCGVYQTPEVKDSRGFISSKKIKIIKPGKISPLDLMITPNITSLETTEGVVPNLTCTAMGTNLPNYIPYVLSWYIEDVQLNSGYNVIVLPINKTFTSNDTNKEIYCAMKWRILSDDVYTFVLGHRITIKKVSKPLKSGSDRMENRLLYIVTFINLLTVSLVI